MIFFIPDENISVFVDKQIRHIWQNNKYTAILRFWRQEIFFEMFTAIHYFKQHVKSQLFDPFNIINLNYCFMLIRWRRDN